MPTYEYTCPACGAFEAWRPAAESSGLRRQRVSPLCAAQHPDDPAPLGAAIELSERSAYEPQVATTPPHGGISLHGGHRRSPRRPWQLG